jgi:hypothetical protein
MVLFKKKSLNSMRVVSTPMLLSLRLRNGKIANAAAVIPQSSLPSLSLHYGMLPAWFLCWTPAVVELWLLSMVFASDIYLLSDFGGPFSLAAGSACPSAVICADAAAEPSSV